jgi:hypothetical protein
MGCGKKKFRNTPLVNNPVDSNKKVLGTIRIDPSVPSLSIWSQAATARRPGQGRRRTTTAQRECFLLLQSLRHRTLTAPALQVMTLGRYQF